MTTSARLQAAAVCLAEVTLFVAALYGQMLLDMSVKGVGVLLVASGTCFLVGFVPMPWSRSIPGVTVGACVASVLLLGVIDWQFSGCIICVNSPEWSELPLALVGASNLGSAAVYGGAAACGRASGMYVAGMRRRRTRGRS